jgi:hypothetical protein
MTSHTGARRSSGLVARALALLALGALLQHSWKHLGAVHRHRRSARPAAEPPRLQRWEGEGGNVTAPESAGAEATADAAA